MRGERKTHWLRTTILVLAGCCVLGLLLSAALFLRDPGPTYASASMMFTFAGAAEGIAPSGTAFDLRDFDCDEVLAQGLKAAALEDRYTPAQIRGALSVRGVYPKDMTKQVMRYESLLNFTAIRELNVSGFHPTTFLISLSDGFDPSVTPAQLKALLKGIAEAYRAHFTRLYSYGLSENAAFFDLEAYDYSQQLQIIEEQLAALSGYAQELYGKAPAFRFRGMGFNDISVRINALIDGSVTKLSADLVINALTKDADRLLTQYQYQILDLGIQKSKRAEELEKLDKLIASYEKNEIIYLSTADSLTKIDGNSSETYDALMSRRKTVADGITQINSKIANYELMMGDLMRSTGAIRPDGGGVNAPGDETAAPSGIRTAEEAAAAEKKIRSQRALLEENIRALVADGDAVAADLRALLESYNAQQLNEQTIAVTEPVFKTPKLLSGSFAARAVKTTGPIAAVGFMVCMVLLIISRKKEENNDE